MPLHQLPSWRGKPFKKEVTKWTDVSIPLGTMPEDFFPVIAKFNKDPYMFIVAARVVVGAQCIPNIFSVIENRLLDALILLEKEFGNLDELDLDVTEKTPDELQNIIQNLCVVIYHDQSVTIENNNKIKGTYIASVLEE